MRGGDAAATPFSSSPLQSSALHCQWTRRATVPSSAWPRRRASSTSAATRQGGVPHLHDASEGRDDGGGDRAASHICTAQVREQAFALFLCPPTAAFHPSPSIARRSWPAWPPRPSTCSTTGQACALPWLASARSPSPSPPIARRLAGARPPSTSPPIARRLAGARPPSPSPPIARRLAGARPLRVGSSFAGLAVAGGSDIFFDTVTLAVAVADAALAVTTARDLRLRRIDGRTGSVLLDETTSAEHVRLATEALTGGGAAAAAGMHVQAARAGALPCRCVGPWEGRRRS